VSEGVSLGELREFAQQGTKSEFDQKLRRRVFEEVIDSDIPDEFSPDEVRARVDERLANLDYDGSQRSRQEIRSLLLLFNVATLLQSKRSNMRFQFDSFKNQEWNIEHVRSIASEPPRSHAERQAWLKLCLAYLECQNQKLQKATAKMRAEIGGFLALTKQDAADVLFLPVYQKVLDYFGESKDSEAVHGIANLALLDEGTNKSYKNAPFAVKRERLLKLDQAGIFVPLCTRNVFLKCYSPKVDNVMFWSEDDQTAYQKAISETLVGFFTRKMEDTQ